MASNWTFPKGFENCMLNFFKFYKAYRKIQNFEPKLEDVLLQASYDEEYHLKGFFDKKRQPSPPVRRAFEAVLQLYKFARTEEQAAAHIKAAIERGNLLGEEFFVVDSTSTPLAHPAHRTRSLSRVSDCSPTREPLAQLAEVEVEKEQPTETDDIDLDESTLSDLFEEAEISHSVAAPPAAAVPTIPSIPVLTEQNMTDFTPAAGLVASFCDDQIVIGQNNTVPPGFEIVELTLDPGFNKSNNLPAEYPRGFAVYVKRGEKANVKRMTNNVVTNLKVALTYYNALKSHQLDADAEVDVHNMTQEDLDEYRSVRESLESMRQATSVLRQLKGRIRNTLKSSSCMAITRFFNRILEEVESVDSTANLWCQKRDTGTSSAGNNLSVANLSTTLGGVHLGGNPPTNANATAVPSTFNLKMGTAKLPEVKLKKFDGLVSSFLRWRADFEKYVLRFYNDKYMDEYQLMTYLHDAMPPSLQSKMKNMPWDYPGFLQMWKELDRQFGSQLTQVLNWRKMLQTMKPPTTEVASISQFRLEVNTAVNGLLLAGQTVIQEGETWLAYLLPKLPTPLMTSWITSKNLNQKADPTNWAKKPCSHTFLNG